MPRCQKCLDEVNNSVQTLLTQMYFVNAIRYSSDQPFDKLIILEDSSGFTFWTHTVQHQRINNKYTVNQKEKLALKKLNNHFIQVRKYRILLVRLLLR